MSNSQSWGLEKLCFLVIWEEFFSFSQFLYPFLLKRSFWHQLYIQPASLSTEPSQPNSVWEVFSGGNGAASAGKEPSVRRRWCVGKGRVADLSKQLYRNLLCWGQGREAVFAWVFHNLMWKVLSGLGDLLKENLRVLNGSRKEWQLKVWDNLLNLYSFHICEAHKVLSITIDSSCS